MFPLEAQNLYEALGDDLFRSLVDVFYRRVEADPELRAIFPPDLTEGKDRQYLFLTQYFGGPARYNERHGQPMLRRRHFPFPITPQARDRWLTHMLAALEEVAVPEPYAAILRDYFERFSLFMINHPSDT